MKKKLYRTNNVLGGVCGGLSEYSDIDVNILRALFVLGSFFMMFPILLYLILWILVPEKY